MSDSKLLLAAMYVLSLGPHSELLSKRHPQTQTAGVLPRYKHKSELDAEKFAAKRKEIAEWNQRLEKANG